MMISGSQGRQKEAMGAVGAWIPSRPSTAGAFFRSTGNEGPALSNFLTFLKKTRHMGLLIKPPIFRHWQLFFLNTVCPVWCFQFKIATQMILN